MMNECVFMWLLLLILYFLEAYVFGMNVINDKVCFGVGVVW